MGFTGRKPWEQVQDAGSNFKIRTFWFYNRPSTGRKLWIIFMTHPALYSEDVVLKSRISKFFKSQSLILWIWLACKILFLGVEVSYPGGKLSRIDSRIGTTVSGRHYRVIFKYEHRFWAHNPPFRQN